MNKREAKRATTTMVARFARERAEAGRREPLPFAPEVTSLDDTRRLADAFEALAEEMERRVTGERRPNRTIVDPGQLSWLDPEVTNG